MTTNDGLRYCNWCGESEVETDIEPCIACTLLCCPNCSSECTDSETDDPVGVVCLDCVNEEAK